MNRRNPDPIAFRFDAGRVGLDFVGTVGHRPAEHRERLTGPDRLRDWLLAAGLPAPAEAFDEAGLAHAIELREALCDVLDHGVEPCASGAPEAASVAVVNAALAVAPPVPTLRSGDDGLPVVRYDDPVTLDAVLSVLARDLVELLGDDTLRAALRRCEAGDCRKVFLDTAPRARRWCSRQYCGTRSRVAAHRSRADRPLPS